MDSAMILLVLAIFPGLFLIFYVYNHDKIEKEPFGLLFKLVFLGVLIVIPVIAAELVMEKLVVTYFSYDHVVYSIADSFLVAALVEELFKMAALKAGSWRSKSFDYQFDGVVYAVCVGLGFAIAENVLYVMESGFTTAILRAITAVPQHGIFALYMGYHYGLAKKYSVTGYRFKAQFHKTAALVVPMFLHGTYDSLAFIGTEMAVYGLIGFVIVCELLAIININRFSRGDKPFISYRPTDYFIDNNF